MDFIMAINDKVNAFVWGPIMLALLVGTGVYLSVRVGFIQVGKFGYMWKNTIGTLFDGKHKDKLVDGITPFQAVSTALASTVGTGNITGIATAITIGGPGAVFWMWVSAFFGMVTKYSEILLALTFREKNAKGENVGGPMYYIENGLGWKWMAVLFAIFAALASFGIGNMTQSNSIAQALEQTFSIPTWISGVIVAIVVAVVILGGIKSIASVNEKVVPFMAAFYIVCAVIVLIVNFQNIPHAFALIFENAFTLPSAAGGAAGYTIVMAMRYGFARGVFSNEAGLGSAPIAHAASSTQDPVEQGLWGIFEVFLDTIVICTLTALVVLTSGLWNTSGLDGAPLSIAAFNQAIPHIGGYGVTIGMVLFATSTMFGWSYYGEKALEYLFKSTSAGTIRVVIIVYRCLFVIAAVVGAIGGLKAVWAIADTLNGLMAIPNLIALLALSGVVIKTTKKGFERRKNNENYPEGECNWPDCY